MKADMNNTPMPLRYMTISDVEYMLDASLMHTPMREKTNVAKSIQSDCMEIPSPFTIGTKIYGQLRSFSDGYVNSPVI